MKKTFKAGLYTVQGVSLVVLIVLVAAFLLKPQICPGNTALQSIPLLCDEYKSNYGYGYY